MLMRRALLGLLLLTASGVAVADPFTIVALGVAAANAAGIITISALGLAAINIGLAVYGAATARRKARRAAARARAEYNASLSDRSVTAVSSEPAFRAIYGRAVVGGDIVAILTSDKQGTRDDGTAYTKPDALKHLVVHLASREIAAIHEVYIDGVAVGTLDGSGWASAGNYAGTPAVSRIATFTGSITIDNEITEVLSIEDPNGTADAGFVSFTFALSNGNKTLTLTPGDAQAVVNYTVTPTASAVRISKHLGTADQVADPYLRSVLPDVWSADHRLRGRAYIVVTLDMEAEPRFQGGPPSITVDASGHKLYDPRKDSTRGGSGSHRLDNPATWEWSANNALVTADVLASPLGYEVDPALDIDLAYLVACANVCDTVIELVVGATTTEGPAYTCNGAFTSTDSKEAVLEDLCESMAGSAVYGASWMLIAGSWTPPVELPGGGGLTDDDLDGQIEIVQAGASMESIFNGVRGTYIPAGKATPIDFAPYQNAAFVTADGRELWSNITLPYTDHPARCQNIARILTEQARDSLVIRYPAKLRAWPLQVGDRVQVTSAEYGFDEKTFRVTDWQFGIASPVLLTLQEDGPDSYDLADAVAADPSPNSNLPNPYQVAMLVVEDPPESGSAHLLESPDGMLTPRVFVQWLPVTDAYVADGTGRIEVAWRQHDRNDWTLINAPGDAVNAYIIGVNEGDAIVIRLVAINGIGARSDPVFLAHTVVGKEDAPSTPEGLAAVVGPGGWLVSVDEPPDPDWTAFELRRDGASWDSGAVPIFSARAVSGQMPFLAAGTHTLRARHWAGPRRSDEATLALQVFAPAQPVVASYPLSIGTVEFRFSDCTTSQPLRRVLFRVGTTSQAWAEAADAGAAGADQRSHTVVFTTSGTKRVMLRGEDAGGNLGDIAVVDLVIDLTGAIAEALDEAITESMLVPGLQAKIELIEPLVVDTEFVADELQRIEVQRLNPLVADTSRFNLDVSRLAEAITNLALKSDKVDGVLRDAGIFVDPVSGKVTISAVEQTRQSLSEVQVQLDAQSASISLRATVAYVDQQIAEAVLDPSALPVFTALDIRLTAAEVDIDGLQAAILLKADSTTVTSQGARLTSAEAAIDGLEGEITLKASTTEVDAIDARLTTAESTLVANGDQAQSIRNLVASTFRLDQAAAQEAGNSLAAILAAHAAGESAQTAVALFREEITAKVNTDISAEVTARTQLGARVGVAEAQLVTEQTVRATADAAMSALITILQAAVAGNTAAINTEATTRADADTSLASLITALTATVGTNTAAISTEATTRADADNALADLITAVQALADTNAAQILSEQTARADADGALTRSTQSLQASNFLRQREGAETAAATLAALIAQHEADTGTRAALAAAREELTSKINGDISAEASRRLELAVRVGTTEANLTAEQLVRGTADSALAQSITSLTATVGNNQASAQGQINTLATQQGATATSVATVQARIRVRPNIVPNGGFERGLSGIGGDLAGWYVGDDVWGRVAYCANLNGTGALFFPAFPAAAGGTYTISGDSLLAGTSGLTYFDIQWLDAGGGTIGYSSAPGTISGAHGFTSDDSGRIAHSSAAVAPSGAVQGRPRFVWQSSVGNTLMGCRLCKVELGGLPATLYTSERESAAQAGLLATVKTTADAAVTASSANATAITAVQATLDDTNDSLAAVEVLSSATATAVGGLESKHTIKTEVRTADGKRVVTGVGLLSAADGDETQSEILLMADKITAVLGSDPEGALQTLFTTGLVNGVATLILRAAWIGDANIETLKIAGNAVTEVYVEQASSVTIAEVKFTPDDYSRNTVIVSKTWTPTISGDILVSVTGQLNYEAAAAGGEVSFYSSIQKTADAFDGFARTNNYVRLPAGTSSYACDISKTRRLQVTAGVSTTVIFCGAKFASGDTVTCTNVEMRIEHIKR